MDKGGKGGDATAAADTEVNNLTGIASGSSSCPDGARVGGGDVLTSALTRVGGGDVFTCARHSHGGPPWVDASDSKRLWIATDAKAFL